jgi:endonuclease/exonuclease/phosphatase family metal-dependent hydrolase
MNKGSNEVSGGILLMWDRRVVEKRRSVWGVILWLALYKTWGIIFFGLLGGVWEELAGLRNRWEVPWCFGGDFNIVRFPSERSSDSSYSTGMMDFLDFISAQGLMDIPLVGGQFTWLNNQENEIWSRIDRFLFSLDWEDHYPTVAQRRLSRLLCDHFPLLLDCGAPT